MSRQKNPRLQRRGRPLPAGATVTKEGINFAIFARHATSVTLVVDVLPAGATQPLRHEFPLDPHENRTGDMWHMLLVTQRRDFLYGYRIDGPADADGRGLVYDRERILIDPCCPLLLPRPWGEPAVYGLAPCCTVDDEPFDWQGDRPLRTPLTETIIYELHVRGFTRGADSGSDYPGTFRGIIDKIPYLQELGITAVELMPVCAFDENDVPFADPALGKPLKNFWGYNPVSFFSLHGGYAADRRRVRGEFKEMVRLLHRAGIEVYLDMVFNHSGEGGYQGVTSSFRGIDNPVYYLLDGNRDYLNFSGCGNTMNCNHPVMRGLILAALRYWVMEMHIDGFRFDLASILGRDRNGNVLANPPMIEVIGEDPVLRDTKMIAEAWDAAGLYQVGSFASDSRWAEWNGRFRDDVRLFMRGDDNSVSHLATRLAGSSDLYQHGGRGPLCSINFVTSHDGFTLADLVSYDDKHNLDNGEDNRDGDNHNLSWNSGHEGPCDDPEIRALRLRRMKTFAVVLLLSQGVPMISAGDEFGRSQGGNNNAWCQDNPTSWLSWSLLDRNRGFFRFFQSLIALRRAHAVFRRHTFFPAAGQQEGHDDGAEIRWQYLTPGSSDWSAQCHGLAFSLKSGDGDRGGSDFFVMLNGDRNLSLPFQAPPPERSGHRWYRIVDSAAPSPADFHPLATAPRQTPGTTFLLPPFAAVVLQSAPGSR